MGKILFFLVMVVFIQCSQKSSGEQDWKLSKDFIEQQLDLCVEKYKKLAMEIPDSSFPKTFEDEKLETSDSEWWTSGFFPGALVYLYEYSQDPEILNQIENRFIYLEKEQYDSTTHDTGFKIYCSFGNALRVTKDTASYKQIILNTANTLSSRFNQEIGCIRSWDFNEAWHYPVIIDNMMNLELLFAATKLTGDSTYFNIAVSHADKTIENHFRENNSSHHVVSYDTSNGGIQIKQTHQGISDESAWARGQAWGLYGFTLCYRFTGFERYLIQAEKIAEFMLNHPNMPDDLIPYWDFDADDIPNALRDASAAAITASALNELSMYSKQHESKYKEASHTIIKNLSDEKYFSPQGTSGNFILRHGVGNMPGKSEIDVPLSYADYYYIELLMRLYRENG